MCDRALGELVQWYVDARPDLSHPAVAQGLALLLRGYLVENLLPKGLGGPSCVYAESAGVGLLAAVGRERGDWPAYVLGLHAFTDELYAHAIDEWRDVSRHEQQHFVRVVRHLLAYSVIKADRVICVSTALEEHLRTRFADYPLPPIITIPNSVLRPAMIRSPPARMSPRARTADAAGGVAVADRGAGGTRAGRPHPDASRSPVARAARSRAPARSSRTA